MDLGCGNGSWWVMEVDVVVGGSGGGWDFGFASCSSTSSNERGETDKVRCERNNKKLIKIIIFKWSGKNIELSSVL